MKFFDFLSSYQLLLNAYKIFHSIYELLHWRHNFNPWRISVQSITWQLQLNKISCIFFNQWRISVQSMKNLSPIPQQEWNYSKLIQQKIQDEAMSWIVYLYYQKNHSKLQDPSKNIGNIQSTHNQWRKRTRIGSKEKDNDIHFTSPQGQCNNSIIFNLKNRNKNGKLLTSRARKSYEKQAEYFFG